MDAVINRAAEYERLRQVVADASKLGARVSLRKNTSNLFRRRNGTTTHGLDVRQLNRVIRIDPAQRLAQVDGMVSYEAFVDATLSHGMLPAVVPQLKTITVGGAVCGLGIESSSLRYGLVHETVESMDILLGDGSVVTCSPTEHADLFFGFPNSYGSLGYALGLTVRLIPAKKYIHLQHTRFEDPQRFFAAMAASDANFVDGTVFGRSEIFLTEGRFTDSAPRVSDYTYMNIYYRSIRQLPEDWLTAKDYIWRWDTDWFWCSKQFHLQNPALRWLAKPWLNSRTYQRWMRLAARYLPDRGNTESVIQDVQIPWDNAVSFFDFLLTEVPILPIWICPFRTFQNSWPLTALCRNQLYVNFGLWDVIPAQGERGYANRKIEAKILQLDGTKGLYSKSYYDQSTFWRIYDRQTYESLKKKADPEGVFRDLFESIATGR